MKKLHYFKEFIEQEEHPIGKNLYMMVRQGKTCTKTKLKFVQNQQDGRNKRQTEAAAGADRGIGPRRNRRKGDKREP